jgi:hypothetical protein
VRVLSLVIKSDGGGNLINPIIDINCHKIKKDKIPTIGGIISEECFFQNLPKLKPPLLFLPMLVAMMPFSFVEDKVD